MKFFMKKMNKVAVLLTALVLVLVGTGCISGDIGGHAHLRVVFPRLVFPQVECQPEAGEEVVNFDGVPSYGYNYPAGYGGGGYSVVFINGQRHYVARRAEGHFPRHEGYREGPHGGQHGQPGQGGHQQGPQQGGQGHQGGQGGGQQGPRR